MIQYLVVRVKKGGGESSVRLMLDAEGLSNLVKRYLKFGHIGGGRGVFILF